MNIIFVLHKDQQQLSIESHDAVSNNKELCLEIATNTDQSTDDLHKSYVSILKQHLTKSEIVKR